MQYQITYHQRQSGTMEYDTQQKNQSEDNYQKNIQYLMEGKHQILFTFYGNAGETINILHKESLI